MAGAEGGGISTPDSQDTAPAGRIRVEARSAQPSAPGWAFPEGPIDALAASLAEAMRLRGHDVSLPTLRAGLALPADGRMTPEVALHAARAQGFRAMVTRRGKLADVPEAVLPAVLFLDGRDACLLVSREPGGKARVIWPAKGEEAMTLPLGAVEKAYSGHALVLSPESEEVAETAPNATRNGHWFWGAVNRHWPDYMQVVLASMVVNLLALVVPLFTMNVYDRVFPNAATVTLWSLVAGVGIALTLDAALKWLRAGVVDKVGRRVDLSVSSALFRHIADLKLEAQNRSTGALMNTLKDYEQVRDFFGSQTVASLTDLAFSVLFLAVIAYIGGPLAIPPAIALTLTLLIGVGVLIPMRRAASAARATGSVKNAVAVEAVTDLETLKAVAGQGRMQRRWETQVTESAMAQERNRRLATFATTATALFQQASSVGIVIVGVYLALEGRITMGAVIAAMILSGRALAPCAALSGLFLRGSFAFSTLKSLNEVMGMASDSAPEHKPLNARIDQGALSLDAVGLRYPDTELNAVEDISLDIAGRERVALVGPVGAGKTSLVRLMAGLYQPTSGMVLLDGTNIKQLGAAQMRSEVQLVPQDAVLFSGSLAENIAFGVPQARDSDVLEAARIAGVDRIAAAHPQGFAMPISERGRNLSGGQRQMVALARALLPRPRVLILDEPTSSMDMASEKLFIQRLAVALERRPMTLVVSTHRMGLLELASRLVVLDQGKVLHDGPKPDVLRALEAAARGGQGA
ncbi:ATP-binding cassette subfamily C protein LapB [Aliiruegeria haliotis]|uniref:ATP-binding cassette subfamily C protein LapB n=1 Tax=Aliiruegeria haliotis TaxID=1280846 RepID=A0A2T0RWA4_9RHOB|nr:ATP-binding cassette subfamily C protein LapB [Aliiruegeria haliotis]